MDGVYFRLDNENTLGKVVSRIELIIANNVELVEGRGHGGVAGSDAPWSDRHLTHRCSP